MARKLEKIIQQFQSLPYDILILKYDVAFTEFCEHARQENLIFEDDGKVIEPEILYNELEIEFIKILDQYRNRRKIILYNYMVHCQNIGKALLESLDEFEEFAERPNYLYQFFQKKLSHLGSSIKLERDVKNIKEKEKEEDPLDFSNSMGTEKIIYLHELGILDFLRNQESCKNNVSNLASVISTFTGITSGTEVLPIC